MITRRLVTVLVAAGLGPLAWAQTGFVNFESPHVSPLAITPDGTRLLAVNTADNRLEIFVLPRPAQGPRTTFTKQIPAPLAGASVLVGIEPVSVRARGNNQAWVVNQISDTISIVNLRTMTVIATLNTDDEPSDVVFAGTPERAFVSCAQRSKLMVFDPADLGAAPTILDIDGEEPRAMTVSADGSTVYLAIFESGNKSTLVGAAGGVDGMSNAVNDPAGPYGGQNPPPNSGSDFFPPLNPANPPAQTVSQIVQKNAAGQWMDDNGGDWSFFVDGGASSARRPLGWDMLDNDVAVIDANTLSISYLTGMMHICMALAVQPASGRVSVVGTEPTNVVRFEPNLTARFLRVNLALGDVGAPDVPLITDLNPHLDYSDEQVAQQADSGTASQALRDLSLGDPRAIVWRADGQIGYVAGMGSNNVIAIDANGARLGSPIVVAEGPTGLVLRESANRLYVLSKFAATLSVIDTSTNTVLSTHAFHDPSPSAIKLGRKYLYDTHLTSGLGQIACASCHIDSRTDHLAWDLGNPAGEMTVMDQNCRAGVLPANPDGGCPDSHPMKGPMVTQTLQDIIGKEPLHWRGDKNGIEEFNGAFTGLQGDDVMLPAQDMQEFEDFLATLHFPPNPYRNFDNTLPTSLPLPDQFAAGEFFGQGGLDRGTPLPVGNPVAGLLGFRTRAAHSSNDVSNRSCVSCHTLPTGLGTSYVFEGDDAAFPNGAGVFVPGTPGPNGELFHSVVTLGLARGQEQVTVKIVQLRDLYRKTGFNRETPLSRAGFGVFNSGSESLAGFMYEFKKFPASDQEVADVVAFLLCFSGSDLPLGAPETLSEPPGPSSQDAHAAVGKQITFNAANVGDAGAIAYLDAMVALANADKVGLVASGRRGGIRRGYAFVGGSFQPDRAADAPISAADLRSGSGTGAEMTFTVVPLGTQLRIGVDRDADGIFDGDEN